MGTPFDSAADDTNADETSAAADDLTAVDDQRAHLRFDKMFVVRLESLLFGEIYCVARNVSAGGIFLELADPLPLGAAVRVCFPVPDGSGEVVATGEVKNHYFINYTQAGTTAPSRAWRSASPRSRTRATTCWPTASAACASCTDARVGLHHSSACGRTDDRLCEVDGGARVDRDLDLARSAGDLEDARADAHRDLVAPGQQRADDELAVAVDLADGLARQRQRRTAEQHGARLGLDPGAPSREATRPRTRAPLCASFSSISASSSWSLISIFSGG